MDTNVPIVPLSQLIQEQLEADNSLLDEAGKGKRTLNRDALTSYVLEQFQINKDAKVSSGIEKEILDSVRAYNGEYSDEELAKIASEGGANIFMNITSTKSRCAKSWLSDIYLNAKGPSWTLEPNRIEEIPEEIRKNIEQAIQQEFKQLSQSPENPQMSTNQIQQTITETNQDRRDITQSIAEEITKEAKFELLNMERKIEDQLNEGKFDSALLTFLEDFCVYPTALLKGPVICKRPKLTWEFGKAVVKDSYFFMNERVDPLDIYPSPDAVGINDGNLIEHLRMSPSTLSNLKDVSGYSSEAIQEVLDDKLFGNSWIDTGNIESDKAEEEYRGDTEAANSNIVHGLHYFGTVPYETIVEWKPDFKIKGVSEKPNPGDLVDVEIILAGEKVIKCSANNDPLKRRPYYKASFANRPGSWWGRSLPSQMSDIQRMCNAAARALANNMAIASGPQVDIYVDRLADSSSLTEIYPRKIWQTIPDPTGAGGRAVNFFTVPIIANELLGVYERFEQKADAVTGIPAYAYGNDRVGAVPATVGGLSIILESASKIIKDCVRNIDEGLIKPRIEYQFYWNLVYHRTDFSGDVNVVPRASSVLTQKSSEALRRQEFLQITANQLDQQVMGLEGRAEILREMANDLGLPGSAIPSKLDIKRQQKKAEQAEAQAQQAAQQQAQAKNDASIAATKVQIDGQKEMHQGTLALKAQELETATALKSKDLQIKEADRHLTHTLTAEQIKAMAQANQEKNKVKEDQSVRQAAIALKGLENVQQ